MILSFAAWWLAATLLGLLAFPLAWKVFDRLPDRGFGFSRALGLLAAGYLVWAGASLGVLRNDAGGAALAVVVLAGSGAWVAATHWQELLRWCRDHWTTLLSMEVVFLLAFALWAFVRANNPDIVATEKPMELAFLTSVLRSPVFPPRDPWLSGYAISYYYFGYVLLAFLSQLTGTTASVTFNLGNALWFALTALGAYSVVFNLLSRRDGRPRIASALLGPLFVLLVGNLEGALDSLHSLRVFWGVGPNGQLASRFWSWLDIVDLSSPPVGDPSVLPGRFLWWWRASRVVHDVSLTGAQIEVIDEFPFFSFLLADNHPHLLALPFVIVAIGFALQVYSAGPRGESRMTAPPIPGEWGRVYSLVAGGLAVLAALARLATSLAAGAAWLDSIIAGLRTGVLAAVVLALLGALLGVIFGRFPVVLEQREFWFAAWLFGSLAFLNTWDWPIYLSLLVAVLWWCSRAIDWRTALKRLLATALGLILAGAVLYLPWYPTFNSQAGGILPNLAFPTRFPQFLIMFGTAFLPILAWLVWRARSQWKRKDIAWLIGIGLGMPLALLLLSWLLGGLLAAANPLTVDTALSGLGANSMSQALDAIAARRLGSSWTALALGLTIALCVVLLRAWGRRQDSDLTEESPDRHGWPFVVVLIGIGALMVLGAEFLYLKDGFGSRMNTVFKFYFAAWLLWGLAAAFIATELWPRRPSVPGALRSLALVPLLLGMVYPALSLQTKTDGFNPAGGRTLDGDAHLAKDDPADYAAILWLDAHVQRGVVAEAVGGSYSGYGRISVHTGLPTVLGWDFHEWQWRGSWTEQGSRKADVEKLYTTRDPAVAQQIVDQYGITLVYIGPLERNTYRPLSESKFSTFMTEVYRTDEVVIFALRGAGVS